MRKPSNRSQRRRFSGHRAVLANAGRAGTTPHPTTQTATEPESSLGPPASEVNVTGQHVGNRGNRVPVLILGGTESGRDRSAGAEVRYDTYRLDNQTAYMSTC